MHASTTHPVGAALLEEGSDGCKPDGSASPNRAGIIPMLANASAVPVSINFRDLASVSKQLRPGVLFRSSQVISAKEMKQHQIKTFLDLRMSPVLCKANLKNQALSADYVAGNTRHLFLRAIHCGKDTHQHDPGRNFALPCQRCGANSDQTYGVHAEVYHVDLLPLTVQLLIMWHLPIMMKVEVLQRVVRRGKPEELVAGAVADPKVVGYAKLYKLMLDHARPQIAKALRLVAANCREGSVLVHCIHGKDRTGIIVALLLKLCGVSDEAIVRDYAVSELRLREGRDASALLVLDSHLTTDEVIASTAEVMVSALDHVRMRYGSFIAYATDALYLTLVEVDEIRSALLLPQARARVEDAERLGCPLDKDPSMDLAGMDDAADETAKKVKLEHVSIAVAAVSRRNATNKGTEQLTSRLAKSSLMRHTLERISSEAT